MKRAIEIDDLYQLEQIRNGEYCASANAICFVDSGHDSRKGRFSRIVVKNILDDTECYVTAGGASESEPRFSPDGRTLAMVSDGRVCFVRLEDGEVTILTDSIGAHDLHWSPTGEKLLFCSEMDSVEAGATEKETALDHAVVITDFGYKFDGAGFVSMRNTHIWTVDLAGNAMRITGGEWDDLFPAITPDGETIVFISGRARSKQESIGVDLFTVPICGGEPKRISQLGAIVSYPIPFQPLITPDGKSVVAAYLPDDATDPRHEKGMAPSRLLYL